MEYFSSTTQKQDLTASGNSMNFIILGDSNVGKTQLMNKYCSCAIGIDAIGNPSRTIGMNLHIKKMNYNQAILLSHFYDLSGDTTSREDLDIFLRLLLTKEKSEYLGQFPIHGIFLVFDVNLKLTLEDLPSWLRWFYHSCIKIGSGNGDPSAALFKDIRERIKNLPVFLIGTKMDKITKEASLTISEINNRHQKQEKVDKIIQHILSYLRKKLILFDFENLILMGKHVTETSFTNIDQLIYSVYERESGFIVNGIELGSYTLERCVNLQSENDNYLNRGIFGFFSKLLRKEEVQPLPLYSGR